MGVGVELEGQPGCAGKRSRCEWQDSSHGVHAAGGWVGRAHHAHALLHLALQPGTEHALAQVALEDGLVGDHLRGQGMEQRAVITAPRRQRCAATGRDHMATTALSMPQLGISNACRARAWQQGAHVRRHRHECRHLRVHHLLRLLVGQLQQPVAGLVGSGLVAPEHEQQLLLGGRDIIGLHLRQELLIAQCVVADIGAGGVGEAY